MNYLFMTTNHANANRCGRTEFYPKVGRTKISPENGEKWILESKIAFRQENLKIRLVQMIREIL